MRNISQETKDSIVNIFPKENTLAIIIFGSFGTDKATYNSDIDIAWIPAKKVPITELAIKTESLRNVLDIDVDLKIVTDNYTVELRKNIFEGDIILCADRGKKRICRRIPYEEKRRHVHLGARPGPGDAG